MVPPLWPSTSHPTPTAQMAGNRISQVTQQMQLLGTKAFPATAKTQIGNANFTSYGLDERIPENDFNNYANDGNGTTETFTSYGRDGNIPLNNFNTYGSGGNGITQKFANYRDLDTLGDNRFRSYGEDSKTESLGFTNYGRSFITDTFREYGKGSKVKNVDFNTYGVGNTFVEYTKTGVTFSNYQNETETPLASRKTTKKMNIRRVEAGKFFREKMLRTGTLMPMPDIKDKMPKRSFLPRTILSKIPFSTKKIDQLKKIFHASDDSSMTKMLGDALAECERAPSPGETKRCAGSGEDMIDFATSVLGRNIAVRSTENTQGSGGNIMIGKVTGIDGGRITKSVSCHQSLYPYLLYYCHSVPKVRVYEADILDPNSKVKINHGVAICHIDTSSWSPNHGAFLALGPGPGKIEERLKLLNFILKQELRELEKKLMVEILQPERVLHFLQPGSLEKKSIRPTYSAEHIFGGTPLAMCSNDFICFYDWADSRISGIDAVQAVRNIAQKPDSTDLQAYLNIPNAGGVWFIEPNSKRVGSSQNLEENDFRSCLNAYFGLEVSRIRDAVDSSCERVLEDLLVFLESPKASARLMYAFQKHSKHIPVVLGSPRLWVNQIVADIPLKSPAASRYSRSSFDSYVSERPGKKMFDSPGRQTSFLICFVWIDDNTRYPQLKELISTTQDLCFRGHGLWISWVSDELSDPII
ncbi:OLC1v1005143C1 [Oldenlandia corymbosa var. corymbosa]|uniref:OLC1v1005143C1 n=1 Tax=Oldenlandia corymbosa var. corymbosa TaxID=529605 RepID=A0AAV1DE66_OLDCO|nr:OLC1v1005143C1 [Oldenlandia corymbosa var. corymbosa]